MKMCNKCKASKELSEFSKNRSRKDGLQKECKACKKERDAEYRRNNREKIAEYQAEYQKNNREKIAEYQAEYRESNPEKVLKQKAEYRKNNREKVKASKAKYRAKNREKIAKRRAERHAKAQRAKHGNDWIPYQSCSFKPHQPGVFYVVKVRNKNTLKESLKIGITNRTAESRFPRNDRRYELLKVHLEVHGPGHACQALEKSALEIAGERGWRAQSSSSGKPLEQMRESVSLGDVLELVSGCEELQGFASAEEALRARLTAPELSATKLSPK